MTMLIFVIKRLLYSIPIIIGVSIIAFSIMHITPGGPLAVYTLNPTITVQDIERIKKAFGLDKPIHVQYITWAKNMVTGEWGRTFFGRRPVRTVIFERIPATVLLMGTAMSFAFLIGVFIGVLGAYKRYSIFDYLATVGAMVALSFPTFWFGLMAIFIFGVKLGWFPTGGMYTLGMDESILDLLRHLVLPALVLALILIAQWARYTRSSFLDVINQDYIRTAKSKGISGTRIFLFHSLPNAAAPLITLAGIQVPWLFSGALVTESVFAWPGMGLLFVNALTVREYPILMGMVVLTAFLVIVGNLMADLATGILDPRIRLK